MSGREALAEVLCNWWASEIEDADEAEFIRTSPECRATGHKYADTILASDWLADLLRREREAAWDEGYQRAAELVDPHVWADSNPYRADGLAGGGE